VAPQLPGHDYVAVVRVHLREGAAETLIVELLEVGRDPRADRQIGRATDPATAARLLRDWLTSIAAPVPPVASTGDATDDGVTAP
jgi:hypothetical protein